MVTVADLTRNRLYETVKLSTVHVASHKRDCWAQNAEIFPRWVGLPSVLFVPQQM